MDIPKKFDFNFRHLLVMVEIKNSGSISRASERIHLSQSALTQGLHKLERAIGVKLFDRSFDGMQPTDVGSVFIGRIERGISHLEKIDDLLGKKPLRGHGHLYRSFSFSHLRAFLAVVTYGSFSVASTYLKLSQPTIHRAVREFEITCDKQCFHRTQAGIEAKTIANRLARQVFLFYSELEQAIDEANEFLGNMTSRLRVGSLPLARASLVPKVITNLLNEFPSAQVSIIDGPYEEQLHGLLHGQIDFIVGALRSPSPDPEIEQTLLFQDPLCIVVKPQHFLAKRASRNIEELRSLEWIAPKSETPSRIAFTHFFEEYGVLPPDSIIECSSFMATRSLILNGNRVALLTERQVELEVQAGLLAVSPQKLEGTSREIGLTRRKSWMPTSIQQRFIEMLFEAK